MKFRVMAMTAVAAMAVSLTACAPERDPDWHPAQWQASVVTVAEAEAEAQPAGELDPELASLVPRVIRNDDVGIVARWVEVPGFDAFGAAAAAVVHAEIAHREAATGRPYEPQAHPATAQLGARMCVPGSAQRDATEILTDPVLGPPDATGSAIVCEVSFAGDTIIGLVLRTVRGTAGAVESDHAVELFGERATGTVFRGADVWSSDAPAALWTMAIEAIRRQAGSLTLSPVGAPDAESLGQMQTALAHGTFDGEGGVSLVLPVGLSSPELEALDAAPREPLLLGAGADAVAPLLTDTGRTLLAASARPYDPGPWIPAGHLPVDCSLLPCVALTYDDGPSELTGQILDALAERGAAATFYVLGGAAAAMPEMIQRIAEEGHAVGNHTWNHPDLRKTADADIRSELQRTDQALIDILGTPSRTYRPPYGEVDSRVQSAAGKAAILWDVDTNDWRGPADAELVDHAVTVPQPRSIVLMHDVHEVTAGNAAAILDGLLDRGFVPVTIPQLFGGESPASGIWRRGPQLP